MEQKLRLFLLIAFVMICYLIVAVIQSDGHPFAAEHRAEIAKHILGEIAAALVAAIVAVILIDRSSRRELERAVDLRLQAGTAKLDLLETHIRGEMQAAGMCYRMFGHPGDETVILNVNERILQKSILRISQDITCTFQARGGGDDSYLEMTCACVEKYKNLSATPQRHGFALVIDRSRLVAGAAKPLAGLTVTPLDAEGNDREPVEIDPERDLIEDVFAGAVYSIRDKRDAQGQSTNAAFTIEGGRSVRHTYQYVMRQPLSGREDFCMRDVTVQMIVRAVTGSVAGLQVRLEPQTDLPNNRRKSSAGNVELGVGPVLLPMQGIVLHWSRQA